MEISPVDDWLSAARGGFDMWALADQVIEERRMKREGGGNAI